MSTVGIVWIASMVKWLLCLCRETAAGNSINEHGYGLDEDFAVAISVVESSLYDLL